jgi:hypothetical protein
VRIAACLSLLLLGCTSTPVSSVRESGTVPNPPGATGRDSGMSVKFGAHSVWLFGDTFFSDASSDGYHWRSSTWSWTDDLTTWSHALDLAGKPLQLLPHTRDEQAFDDAHNGTPCPAQTGCGARHTPWPMGVVLVDPASGAAWVPYTMMVTEPGGPYAFKSRGMGLAQWASPGEAAVRPQPQPLFGADEPSPGAGGLIVDGDMLLYACLGSGNPCTLARVPVAKALERRAWTFWDGSAYVADWHSAKTVFTAAPYVTVAFNTYLGKYTAWYMTPLDDTIWLRTADRPEGPWSGAQKVGTGAPSQDPQNWDYALVAHPEFDKQNGRVVTLSYFQPGAFLNGVVHLLEVTLK